MASSPRIAAAGLVAVLALLLPAGSPAGAQGTATLQLSPSSGGPGTVVSVVGNGFVPCLSFTVRWDSPRVTVTGDPVSHRASLFVPEGAGGGSHTITANCDPLAAGGAGPLQIAVGYFDVIAPPPPADPAPVTGPAPP
ncbi:MAG: hypothetical protein M3179_08890, partial [Actinomycetota bacterium]|nr:hypothetical protein [Actinomycetota bacterium]